MSSGEDIGPLLTVIRRAFFLKKLSTDAIVRGNRYPIPHLSRWVGMMEGRWGIGSKGGEALSSYHL
jgi:hypothetical protein